MERVSLPDEQWIDLRSAKTVSERKRRPVVNALSRFSSRVSIEPGMAPEDVDVSGSDYAEMSEVNDLVAVALITAWSFDGDVTVDALLDLPGEQYDAIRKAVAPRFSDLMPDFGATKDLDTPSEPAQP